MIHLSEEPLWPHLVDLARRPEFSGSILAGGLGLRLKRAHVLATGERTLFGNLPELRPTLDIDLFLAMEIWMVKGERLSQRQALEALGYQPQEESWKFQKPGGPEASQVTLDLMARAPLPGEDVKVRPPRVGVGQGADLHGFLTPEGFAIEDEPIELLLQDGDSTLSMRLAHPYTFLNLKITAAYDWVKELRGEVPPKGGDGSEGGVSRRLKHVTDVYAIAGMMTEQELESSQLLAARHREHRSAIAARQAAAELFGSRDALGSNAIRLQRSGTWEPHFRESYDAFWEALSLSLGIAQRS